MVLRRGGPQDVRFLRDMLHHAYYWKERQPDEGPGPVALYVKAWGRRGDTAVIALDLAGVAVSSGAACSSGKVQPSHVLAAMGVAPHLAQGGVRVSLGPSTTESELDGFIAAWIAVSEALLRGARGIAA